MNVWTQRRRNRKRGERNLDRLNVEVSVEAKAALRQMAAAAGMSLGEAVEALVRKEMRRQDARRMPEAGKKAA